MGRPVGAHRAPHRPAALVFLAPGDRQIASDPSLTQEARLPAEIGRIEFKTCDAIDDLALYGELLSLAHRHVARVGPGDDAVHAGAGALLGAAEQGLAGRGADLARLASLRERWVRCGCPALHLLAEHARTGRPCPDRRPLRHMDTCGCAGPPENSHR